MKQKNKEQFDGFFLREEDGAYGKSMVLNKPWDDSFGLFMEEHNIQWLRLSHSAGWKGDNIDFVSGLKNLKVFELYDWSTRDVTPIHSLSNLEQISLSCNLKTTVDFSQFPKLLDCYLVWTKKVDTILQCTGLTRLNIVKYPYEDITSIGHMKSLTELQLTSHKLKTLDGIQNLKNLTLLDLSMCVKLEALTGIGALSELAFIDIQTCKKLYDFSEIGQLKKLTKLIMSNCGKIKSIKMLQSCEALQKLFFIDSTIAEDGDMSCLLDMPNLTKASFVNRSHYSHTKDEIRTHLAKRTTSDHLI